MSPPFATITVMESVGDGFSQSSVSTLVFVTAAHEQLPNGGFILVDCWCFRARWLLPSRLNSVTSFATISITESVGEGYCQSSISTLAPATAVHEQLPDGGFILVDCRRFRRHQLPRASTAHLCY